MSNVETRPRPTGIGRLATLLLVGALLAGCSAQDDPPPTIDRAGAIAAAQAKGASLAGIRPHRRFRDLAALRKAADRIVVATRSGYTRPTAAYFDPKHPVVDVPIEIDDVIKGPGKPGQTLLLTLPGKISSAEGVSTRQFTGRDTALLFLTTDESGRHRVVGHLAGQFDRVNGIGYVKIDTKNPGLPDVLTVADGRLQAVPAGE